MTAVLDASALLALLNAETGGDRVAVYIPGAHVSAVNLGEVASKLTDAGVPLDDVKGALQGLGLLIHPLAEEDAWDIGELRPGTRARGLSIGDRACLGLARRTGLPAVTADRSWDGLALGIQVVLIR